MEKRIKKLYWTNTVVIIITLSLFISALFTKGITHDVFLEAAVFLVSIKLILATAQIKNLAFAIGERLEKIDRAIKKLSPGDRS